MNIFITGATGYVGSHLLEELAKEHHITALVRKKNVNKRHKELGITEFKGDITDFKSLEPLFNEEFDSIIHLATSLFPVSDPNVNEHGLDNILKIANQKELKRFIYVSSALVYGPIKYCKDAISEEVDCKPKMNFAKQQYRGESKCLDAYRKKGLPIVIFRPSELIGGKGGYFKNEYLEGIKKRKLPQIGKGINRISMTHVDDFVTAIIASLNKQKSIGEIFNLNIPDTIKLKDLNNFLSEKLEVKSPIKLPKFIAIFAGALVPLLFKIIGKTAPLNLDIVRVGTMDGPARDISKAEKILNIKPIYNDIRLALENSYF